MKLARRSATEREAELERCEFCGAPIATEHSHVLQLPERDLKCSCRPCALLFERTERFKLVGDRRVALADAVDDATWMALALPVDVAFFFDDGERLRAYYPSPMGPTESLLDVALDIELEPDVEAVLVDRVRGARRQWLVPISDCYELVGLIRTHWRGLTGGRDVWEQLDAFFANLDRRAS
jgi:hypothetical protein